MKKIVIPMLIFLVLGIGSIVYFVSASYTMVQYNKDARFHLVTLQDGETLNAEYKGSNTKVLGRNSERIYKVLTSAGLKRLYFKPEFDDSNAIYLKFSDGAEYIITENSNEADSVFIFYTYKSKKLWFKISGYNSFSWTERAISPSGIYNENEVLTSSTSSK